MTKSKIAWTERVWNPVTGCTKVSAGCKNCYAEAIAHRYWGERKFTDVRTHPDRLDAPLHWRKPSRVFVNSMSDLFHEDVPDEFIAQVFGVMAVAEHHVFQVLTKRPGRMCRLLQSDSFRDHFWRGANQAEELKRGEKLEREMHYPTETDQWLPLKNVWLGVSVENQEQADTRIPPLLQTPAAVRWLSVEPMLGPVDFFENPGYEMFLDWMVVGGESGANFREMDMQAFETFVLCCRGAGVPIFVKQDSGRFPGKQGRIPDELWIKEYPADVDPRPSPVA